MIRKEYKRDVIYLSLSVLLLTLFTYGCTPMMGTFSPETNRESTEKEAQKPLLAKAKAEKTVAKMEDTLVKMKAAVSKANRAAVNARTAAKKQEKAALKAQSAAEKAAASAEEAKKAAKEADAALKKTLMLLMSLSR